VSTWTRNIAYTQINNKKGVRKMTEETTPKPAAEKAEESTPKQAAADSEKSTPKTVAEEPKKTTKKPVEKQPDVVFVGNKPPMSYVSMKLRLRPEAEQ
jgi:hypothetical protein